MKFFGTPLGHFNTGLFSIAPHLVIPLRTFGIAKVVAFNLCLNFCKCFVDWLAIDSCRSFAKLKALAKIYGNLFTIASESEKERQL